MTTLIVCAATAVLAFIIGTIFGGIMVGGGDEDAYKSGLRVGAEEAYDHSIEGQVRSLHRELADLSTRAKEGSGT